MTEPPAEFGDWWTVAEVADFLGITKSSVRAYAAEGRMPAPDRKIGSTPIWRPETIREWHASRPRKGQAQPEQ